MLLYPILTNKADQDSYFKAALDEAQCLVIVLLPLVAADMLGCFNSKLFSEKVARRESFGPESS